MPAGRHFSNFFRPDSGPPPGTYASTAKKGKFICTGHFFPHGISFSEKGGDWCRYTFLFSLLNVLFNIECPFQILSALAEKRGLKTHTSQTTPKSCVLFMGHQDPFNMINFKSQPTEPFRIVHTSSELFKNSPQDPPPSK